MKQNEFYEKPVIWLCVTKVASFIATSTGSIDPYEPYVDPEDM